MPIFDRNVSASPGLFARFRHWLRLVGKYSLSSLSATALDFATFHLALTGLLLTAVQSTVAGRCVGAILAFWMQRRWVFQRARATNGFTLMVKYLGGVFLGMGLNVSGVWLFHHLMQWTPWPARIISAVASWFVIFLFNHYLVFNPATNRQPYPFRT